MQLVNWRGKRSLFGSSKAGKTATSVDLWQISP
jgi:hypothetical protein